MAVALVVLTSCSCAFCIVEEDEEPDGNPVAAAYQIYHISVNIQKVYKIYNTYEKIQKTYSKSALIAGILLGMPVGAELEKMALEHELEELREQIRELQQTAHLNEAKNTTNMMRLAGAFTENSLNNYENIWKMTEEHWIRQAEMSAFSLWQSGVPYDPEFVMLLSMIYFNNAMMGANSTAQFNTFMGELSSHVDLWRNTEGYENMTAYYSIDGERRASIDHFDGRLLSVADTRNSEGYIYIQTELFDTGDYIDGVSDTLSIKPGTMYLFGDCPVTLTDREGHAFVINSKVTDLTAIEGLNSGIYKVSEGSVIASDSFAEAVGVIGHLPLNAGLVMEVGDTMALAVYLPTISGDGFISVIEDGQPNKAVSNIYLGAQSSDIPEGKSNPDPMELRTVLESYSHLLAKIREVAESAESSSKALWKIYDAAGESNAWITTLSVLNNYEDVAMSDTMKSAMAVSAMQQIADYYDSHNGDLTGMKLSLLGEGAEKVPFIRGTIYDNMGNIVASDVIFTPLLQTQDTTINRLDTVKIDSYATAMVWAQGQSILTWGSTGDFEDYTAIPLKKGYSFTVNEIAMKDTDDSDLRAVNSVDLDVKQLDYVPGVGFEWDGPEPIPPVTQKKTNWLEPICIIAGIILAVYGIVTRRLEIVILGVGILLFGVLVSDWVWNKLIHIDKWTWFA